MSAPAFEPLPRVSVTPAGAEQDQGAALQVNGGSPFGAAAGLAPDVAAPVRSALSGLRARVQAARARRHLDLRVPGLGDPSNPYDPEALFMRFTPLSASDQAAVMDAPATGEGFAAEWNDAVRLLPRACVGIFTVDAQGHPVGDPATWPRISFELAEQLGLDLSGSTDRFGDLLRSLFVADQDVVMTAQVYSRWLVDSARPTERQSPEA